MNRVIALLVLAGASALLAGCGGGGGGTEPLTKAEYQTQMQTIGDKLGSSLGSLGTATSADKAVTALEKVQTDLRASADDMDEISPPEAVETEHDDLVAGVRQFADELDPIIERLEKGNLQALASVTAAKGLTAIQNAAEAISKKGYKIGSS
jgi:soluble cytochrome b562